MWIILKIFIEFVTILLLFYVLDFWPRGMWDPQPGIQPAPPAVEGEVLMTGPPEKSLSTLLMWGNGEAGRLET